MAKAHLIAHIRVHDPEKFAEFAAVAGPNIAQHGGRGTGDTRVVVEDGPTVD